MTSMESYPIFTSVVHEWFMTSTKHNLQSSSYENSKPPRVPVGTITTMKPAIVADEMFPEGAGPYMDLEDAGGASGLLMELTANEKSVHADFFNDFEDLFDDEDLQ